MPNALEALDKVMARGPADDTSLLVQYSDYQCITPLIQPVAGFDPATNLLPLGHLIDAPQLLVASSWFAVYGPTRLSADLQGRLSLAIKQVVESEIFKKRADDQGAKAVVMNGAKLA